MPMYDRKCSKCERVTLDCFEPIALAEQPKCAECGGETERVFLPSRRSIIDDTLPGGARYMHNLGDAPVWVETKSQLNRELAARGLVQQERSSYSRDDKSPWATRTRLRPGARDPFLHRA